MPLIEELDLEVETLDSFEGLRVKPEAADRLSDQAPGIRLACAGAVARPSRARVEGRRAGLFAGPVARIAALLLAAAALGFAWHAWRQHASHATGASTPSSRTASTISSRTTSSAVPPSAAHPPTPAAAVASPPPAPRATPAAGASPRPTPLATGGIASPPPSVAPGVLLPGRPPVTPPAAATTSAASQVHMPPAAPPRVASRPLAVPGAVPAPAPIQTAVPTAPTRPSLPDTSRAGTPRPSPAGPRPAPPAPPKTAGLHRGPAGADILDAPHRTAAPRLKDPLPDVTGILVSYDRRLATVAGHIVAVGDMLGRRRVVAIDDRTIVLREPSGVQIV